jgi:zinc protease
MRHQLSASLIALALALPGFAQGSKGVSLSKVERKNLAPVSHQPLKVRFPRAKEFKLENGLTVLILEDHRLPLVDVTIHMKGAGSLFDPQNRPGLAQMVAFLLGEGTTHRTSQQCAADIERLGANFGSNAPFGSPEATHNGSGLSDNFDQWFELYVDMILHSVFPQEELDSIRLQQLAQLQQQEAQPGFLAIRQVMADLYGRHPAAITSATAASLKAMTRDELVAWCQVHYAPQNSTLAIAGDVRAEVLMPKLRKWFATWTRTSATAEVPPPTAPTARHLQLVDRPGSVQTTLVLANQTVDRRSPDFIPFTVLNRVVGGGPQARLFTNLREVHGYTYGAYSRFMAGAYPGSWQASADVRNPVTAAAMTEFMNEYTRIRQEEVPLAELNEAEGAIVAGFALSLEQPSEILGRAVDAKTYGFPVDYWDTYPAKIAAVTAPQVKAVAAKYLNPATLQIVAVGDASKIKSDLEAFGKVELIGTQAK